MIFQHPRGFGSLPLGASVFHRRHIIVTLHFNDEDVGRCRRPSPALHLYLSPGRFNPPAGTHFLSLPRPLPISAGGPSIFDHCGVALFGAPACPGPDTFSMFIVRRIGSGDLMLNQLLEPRRFGWTISRAV
jgi:hypothetical protein